MKRHGIIYCITNVINNKKYIGLTRGTLVSRYGHKWWKSIINTHLKDSIKKYGYSNFKIEELCSCSSEEELISREIYFIEQFNTLNSNFGYNLALGGLGGHPGQKAVETTRKKLKEFYLDKNNIEKLRNRIKKAFKDDATYKKRMISSLKDRYKDSTLRDECALIQGSKPFLVYDKAGNFVGEWLNKTRCAEELNLRREHVRDCLAGKRKSSKNYKFKYKN
jgi:group I intron endonuclease